MNIPTNYGPSRNRRTWVAAIGAAGMMTVMLLTQLYGYEDFSTVLSGLLSSNDMRAAVATAGLLVLAQLLSLPYLLGMYLSKLMRIMSASLSFVVACFWLFTMFTNAHAENSGVFSSVVILPGGIIAALWASLLFFLIAYTLLADSRFRHASS
jgi:glucan phosphoethanolaminetransferase (alkaline phosphatase superfamily)